MQAGTQKATGDNPGDPYLVSQLLCVYVAWASTLYNLTDFVSGFFAFGSSNHQSRDEIQPTSIPQQLANRDAVYTAIQESAHCGLVFFQNRSQLALSVLPPFGMLTNGQHDYPL